jgi:acylphosphatase
VALLHVAVEGRVQGVGFRWFVRQRARASDLAGWVRNHPDGTVEIAAEGAEEGIQRLRREIGRGPQGARVSGVTELGPVEAPLERPFAIRK